jgi:hypothetical protein
LAYDPLSVVGVIAVVVVMAVVAVLEFVCRWLRSLAFSGAWHVAGVCVSWQIL